MHTHRHTHMHTKHNMNTEKIPLEGKGREGGELQHYPLGLGLRSRAARFSEPVSNMNLVAVFPSLSSCIIYLE